MSNNNISEVFYEYTGVEYSPENAEKLLKGEIKYKFETAAENYLGGTLINLAPAVPYISEYYVNETTLENLKNSRTELNEEEIEKYETVKNAVSREYQIKLENALQNGQLLQDNSENKTTVLENLYKIITEPRAENLGGRQIMEECIEILDNPYVITQIAENIPEEYQEECTNRLIAHELETQEKRKEENESVMVNNQIPVNTVTQTGNLSQYLPLNGINPGFDTSSDICTQAPIGTFLGSNEPITEQFVRDSIIEPIKDELFNYRSAGTCAAASIEFYMANNYTAEFFRMIEELTSEKKSFTKMVNLTELNNEWGSEQPTRADSYNVPYEMIDENNARVTITADENAYLLAEIQMNNKDPLERSMVDIIIQAAIMNLGSKQTYESIGDRYGNTSYKLFEFAESGLKGCDSELVLDILTNENPDLAKYKAYDFDGFKNIFNSEDVKNEILAELKEKGSVVIGYVFGDYSQFGHEITIIGYTTNMNGDDFWVIQDSEDFDKKPITTPVGTLLDMIHHSFVKINR